MFNKIRRGIGVMARKKKDELKELREQVMKGLEDVVLLPGGSIECDNPRKVAVPDKWLPICQFMANDFDEALGAYTGAQSMVDLQQNSVTKEIRTVKVGY